MNVSHPDRSVGIRETNSDAEWRDLLLVVNSPISALDVTCRPSS